MPYHCETCGQVHDDLPDIGAAAPDQWLLASDEEKAAGECTPDRCRLGDDYFIRGVIELPVHDHDRTFGFGVWVSQSRASYETYLANPTTSAIGPFFGWLNTRIAYYQPADTRALKTRAHFLDGNRRPRIELHPDETHPLAVAQREGVTLAAAWAIVHFYMPAEKKPAKRKRR